MRRTIKVVFISILLAGLFEYGQVYGTELACQAPSHNPCSLEVLGTHDPVYKDYFAANE